MDEMLGKIREAFATHVTVKAEADALRTACEVLQAQLEAGHGEVGRICHGARLQAMMSGSEKFNVLTAANLADADAISVQFGAVLTDVNGLCERVRSYCVWVDNEAMRAIEALVAAPAQ